MDSVLEGLGTVKDQLRKMEERKTEKGLQQSLKRAVNKLEQDCKTMNERKDIRSQGRDQGKGGES